MISGITEKGFEYNIDEKTLEDWRFIRAIRKINAKNDGDQIVGAVDLVSMLFGDDEDEFLATLADEDGTVTTTAVMTEVFKVLEDVSAKRQAVKNL